MLWAGCRNRGVAALDVAYPDLVGYQRLLIDLVDVFDLHQLGMWGADSDLRRSLLAALDAEFDRVFAQLLEAAHLDLGSLVEQRRVLVGLGRRVSGLLQHGRRGSVGARARLCDGLGRRTGVLIDALCVAADLELLADQLRDRRPRQQRVLSQLLPRLGAFDFLDDGPRASTVGCV